MATMAYDASLIERIMPRIRQYEATTGRKIAPSMLDALIKGQLSTEADRAGQERAFGLQERSLSSQEQAAKDAASAAKVKGAFDIASTAGMGYLTYKAVTKPSAMSELLAYQKSLQGLGAKPLAADVVPSLTAPAYTGGPSVAPSLTTGTSGVEYGSGIGAQTALGGGTPAVGGQVALAGGAETGSLAAYDASLAAGAAEGVGSTAGTGATSLASTAASYATPAAVALAGRPVGTLISKALGTHQKTTQDISETAGYAGAGFLIGGPVGAVVGGIVGAIKGIADTVICGELLRQGRITDHDRQKCIIFRFRYIPVDMFHAYTELATPIVKLMRRGSVPNKVLLPFAMKFVGYMLAIQAKRVPSFTERMVWKWAWWRCSKIAHRRTAMVGEVQLGIS